ncbi:sigma-70 family RNA polymerase sigma factor [Candidatus Aerophobetes bacterium]|nr:sigma-70 family RNA polymerase sigma factor [Candidatus Aerophobetes bacterium]
MNLSDSVLLEKSKKGDEESFRKLVEKYQSKVYSIAFAMVKNKTEAEDIMQDIFIKVYRSLGNFKGKSKFYTWLYRITINTCINHLNHNKKTNTISLSSPENREKYQDQIIKTSLFLEDSKSPFEILQNRELEEKIKLAIESLPLELKQVFLLREIDDLSYKEMAKILNCSEGTIKSRLFRARDKLREKIGPYLWGKEDEM